MATDGPDPPAPDPTIFKHGTPVIILDGSSNAIERWVRLVAATADAFVDWHYVGARAVVLHLGDRGDRARVEAAIDQWLPSLQGGVVNRHPTRPWEG